MGQGESSAVPSAQAAVIVRDRDGAIISAETDPDVASDLVEKLAHVRPTPHACSPTTMQVHWMPMLGSSFCRQACAPYESELAYVHEGSCEGAGFGTFLGAHSRAGAPGFDGKVIVSDFTSLKDMASLPAAF